MRIFAGNKKKKHMNYPLNFYASRNPLNAIIAENMVDLTMLEEEDSAFEYKACFCFSKAYQICQKMMKEYIVQLWSFPDYRSIANYGSQDKDFNKIIMAATLTIVLILTDHYDEEWKSRNQKILNKIKEFILKLYVSGETFNLPGGTERVKPLGPRPVCATIYDILRRGTDIDYVIPLNDIIYLDTRIVDINNLGPNNYITREEVERKIGEQVKIVSDQLKRAIEGKSITDEEKKQMWDEAIFKAKEELKGIIPSFDYDEKNETFSITSSDNVNEAKRLIANNPNVVPQQVYAKALKTIDEQAQTIKNLKAEIDSNDGWYNGEYEKMSDDISFTLRERVVFFSTVLSIELNKKYTVLANLAKFIDELCNDQNHIGPFISKMQKPEEASANAKAAKKVASIMQSIIPKEYQQDKHLKINQYIESMLQNFPESEEE
jgi:hypothetical protein